MGLRYLLLALIVCGAIACLAHSQVQVFARDGREGLRDAEGTELIPAVYDKIGWTQGKIELVGDLIGYQLDGAWGLISVRNKLITEADFYHLSALDPDHVKAAIKGKFSNRLFYGLIHKNGEMVVGCNFFDIVPVPGGYLVSSYSNGQVAYGFLNSEYDLMLSTVYRSIKALDASLLATQAQNRKWSFHNGRGTLLAGGFDAFDLSASGIRISQNGKFGMLSPDATRNIHPPRYKAFSPDGAALPFHTFSITSLSLDSTLTTYGDSIGFDGDLFITYLNGNHEVIIEGKDIYGNQNIDLKIARSGFLVAEDLVTGSWTLIRTNGQKVISDQDSIAFDDVYFFAMKDRKWSVYNRFGRKLTVKTYDEVGKSVASLVPVRRGDYWGMLDFQGNMTGGIKFDRIGEASNEKVLVKYVDKWGLMNLFGDWVVKPSYDSMALAGNGYLGRNRSGWDFLNAGGKRVFSTGMHLKARDGFFETIGKDGKSGAMSSNGQTILYAVYDSVDRVNELFIGYSSGFIVAARSSGEMVINGEDGIADVYGFSEGFYMIKKDERYGYVDDDGKLRIANRYNDIGYFKDGLCPIKLTNWGFINKQEQLVIQPIYESASDFDNGLSVVQYEGKFGVIDENADWIIQPNYEKIVHSPGGGYILTVDSQVGAADPGGSFTLAPQFQSITEVSNGLLIVRKNGKEGVMDANGNIRIPLDYAKIQVKGDYFVMRHLK